MGRRGMLVAAGAGLILAINVAMAGVTAPPLGTDQMRRQTVEHPRAMIRQALRRLDHADGKMPAATERGLLWWMGSAALNINDEATITESILRLDSLADARKDPLTRATADYLRAFQDLEVDNPRALGEALKAAALLQGNSDPKVVAWSMYELCDTYTQLGHAQRALPHCRNAVTAARRVGDTWEVADDENDIAWNLSALHQLSAAVTYYQRARRDFTSIGETDVAAMVGDNLAHTYLLQGQPRRAIALSRASLVHENAAHRHSDALLSRANIARAYAAMGRNQKALALIRHVIADSRKTHNAFLTPDFLDAESHFAEANGNMKLALASARAMATQLRTRHKPGLLAANAMLEKRYATREKELRIQNLEHQNTIKDLALKAARAEAARQTVLRHQQYLRTLVVVIIAVALLMVAVLLYLLLRDQRRHARNMRRQALQDPLTGISNRRAFMQHADEMVAEARLSSGTMHALILIDVDHFKRVNDTAGHPMGDRVLNHVVAQMQRSCGSRGHVSRLGGEEFAVLCPQMDADDAREMAEMLRKNVACMPLPTEVPIRRITISIGVALLDHRNHRTTDSWLRAADSALYMAKDTGRNRVVVVDTADTRHREYEQRALGVGE